MKLLNFKAQNLFSLGEVELSLDKRGLLLVTGHSNDEGGANGSGKSSLSSKGIVWTLYGATAYGDKADAVINRFADEDSTCSGSIDVECNNGDKFRIIRSRRPNRLTVIDLATSTDVSCKLEKDTQAMVDRLLGRTRETFLQTDFFGQGKAANFLDLTPKAQAELLETILPFEELTELADSTKGKLVQLKTVRASIERHVAEHNGKMMEAQRQERELSSSIDTWEQKHDAAIAYLSEQIAQLEANDPTLARIEELKTLVVTLPTRNETQTLIDSCYSWMAHVVTQKEQYNQALAEWRAHMPGRVPEPKDLKCPTCEQGMPHQQFHILKDRFVRNQAQIAEVEHQISNALGRISDADHAIKDITASLDEADRNLRKLNQIDVEIAQLQATRNSDNLATLRKSLEDTQAEVNPYESLYNNNASTLKIVTSTLNHHKSRLAEVDNDQKALEFWQGAFNKDIKNEFLNQVCPFLEGKANLHLEGMGNGQIKVKVSTTKTLKSSDSKSEFTVSCSSATGGSNYESLSGGEKQMVNFAMGLALADLAEHQVDGPSYFMVLDEPFMALDARNSEHLVEYLNSYLKTKKETILLVSNEETLKALIPNRVQVIKEQGISRLEDV